MSGMFIRGEPVVMPAVHGKRNVQLVVSRRWLQQKDVRVLVHADKGH